MPVTPSTKERIESLTTQGIEAVGDLHNIAVSMELQARRLQDIALAMRQLLLDLRALGDVATTEPRRSGDGATTAEEEAE